jgi:hypothetical protein
VLVENVDELQKAKRQEKPLPASRHRQLLASRPRGRLHQANQCLLLMKADGCYWRDDLEVLGALCFMQMQMLLSLKNNNLQCRYMYSIQRISIKPAEQRHSVPQRTSSLRTSHGLCSRSGLSGNKTWPLKFGEWNLASV